MRHNNKNKKIFNKLPQKKTAALVHASFMTDFSSLISCVLQDILSLYLF